MKGAAAVAEIQSADIHALVERLATSATGRQDLADRLADVKAELVVVTAERDQLLQERDEIKRRFGVMRAIWEAGPITAAS